MLAVEIKISSGIPHVLIQESRNLTRIHPENKDNVMVCNRTDRYRNKKDERIVDRIIDGINHSQMINSGGMDTGTESTFGQIVGAFAFFISPEAHSSLGCIDIGVAADRADTLDPVDTSFNPLKQQRESGFKNGNFTFFRIKAFLKRRCILNGDGATGKHVRDGKRYEFL